MTSADQHIEHCRQPDCNVAAFWNSQKGICKGKLERPEENKIYFSKICVQKLKNVCSDIFLVVFDQLFWTISSK